MRIRLPGPVVTFILTSGSALGAAIAPFFVDRKRVERRTDVAYGPLPENRLDVYFPKCREVGKKIPVAILIHGGGFRYFSKESHAAAAARLAESGRVVYCIDYRLAPKHPFPAGLTDALVAYRWVLANAERDGGDVTRLTLVGESSGGGFVASLCLVLFGLVGFPSEVSVPETPSVLPKAAILQGPYLEVSDTRRFDEDPRCFPIARTRVEQIRKIYLPKFRDAASPAWALADPLVAFRELADRGAELPRGFPQFFIPVGETDPVIGDSERMAAALAKLGQADRLRVYPGVGHAFYAYPAGREAKRCWTDIEAFLGRLGA